MDSVSVNYPYNVWGKMPFFMTMSHKHNERLMLVMPGRMERGDLQSARPEQDSRAAGWDAGLQEEAGHEFGKNSRFEPFPLEQMGRSNRDIGRCLRALQKAREHFRMVVGGGKSTSVRGT